MPKDFRPKAAQHMFQFIRSHALLSAAFALALAATLFFLGRFVVSTAVWSNPELREQPVAGWMTPRYVTKSWRVSPEVVAAALSLEMDGTGRRITLEEIAASQGRSLEDLIQTLETALRDARSVTDG